MQRSNWLADRSPIVFSVYRFYCLKGKKVDTHAKSLIHISASKQSLIQNRTAPPALDQRWHETRAIDLWAFLQPDMFLKLVLELGVDPSSSITYRRPRKSPIRIACVCVCYGLAVALIQDDGCQLKSCLNTTLWLNPALFILPHQPRNHPDRNSLSFINRMFPPSILTHLPSSPSICSVRVHSQVNTEGRLCVKNT